MTAPVSGTAPIVVLGAGLAGLTAALALSEHQPPRPVTVIAAYPLGEGCSSGWAQGGIAAAVGLDDTVALHSEDTVKAGVGICDAAIAHQTTGDGPHVIRFLTKHGTAFDEHKDGEFHLGLEGAHSRRRIVHVADQTGSVVMQALIKAVRSKPTIRVIENAHATDLLTDAQGVTGVAIVKDGTQKIIAATKIILATGGAAALWQHTTNPLGNWGSGLALAARAGAELCDLEFMQFHPTAIDVGQDPMPLASEALRGEGALLVNDQGVRFMEDYARQELEPRDVVARAIWQQRRQGHKTFLDARILGDDFGMDFPTIAAICADAGLDPATQPIPISPAAHYHMGGVKADADGRTTVQGLWACGEVAGTGLHGANRLASNSLLEAVSFGLRVARDCVAATERYIVPYATPPLRKIDATEAKNIRIIMSTYVGVLRDADGLKQAIVALKPMAAHNDMALVGLMIARAALQRCESRGAHTRIDFPQSDATWARRQMFTLEEMSR